MRRTLATLGAVLVLTSLAAGPALGAAGPAFTRLAIDDTRFFPAGSRCAFDVVGHRTGSVTIKDWFDADGALARETFTWADGKIEYTNPVNGRSITTILAGPQIVDFYPDGTALVTVPGNDQAAVVPGLGFVAGRTGLSKTVVDLSTGEVLDVLLEAGHQTSPFPAGCVGLE
jgi:hypothetical protein